MQASNTTIERSITRYARNVAYQMTACIARPPNACLLGSAMMSSPTSTRALLRARHTSERLPWPAAVENEGLPVANIEAARRLVIVTPTELRTLCDLLMYLGHILNTLPTEIHCTENRSQSLAFHLLRTMRPCPCGRQVGQDQERRRLAARPSIREAHPRSGSSQAAETVVHNEAR